MASSFLTVLIFCISFWTADGFMFSTESRCVFDSTELKDMEFINSYVLNKEEVIRFSSSVGEFVGYNELGVQTAETWNNDPSRLNFMRAQKERYCRRNTENWYSNILSKSVKPYVTLSSWTPSAGKHQAMLVCSVYGFYPKHIKVSWLRNGETHTSDVTFSEKLPDGDWHYQIHSYLEYTPTSGEEISCMVDHASLSSPLVTDWDPPMPELERIQIAMGVSGLILGLIFYLAGYIYYTRKAGGQILVNKY